MRAHRGAGERIGLAVQLAALGFLGFVPAELGDTPPGVARHVSDQIGVAPATFTRYGGCGARPLRPRLVIGF